MIIAQVIIALALIWLGLETNWLTIRLQRYNTPITIIGCNDTSPFKVGDIVTIDDKEMGVVKEILDNSITIKPKQKRDSKGRFSK